MNAILTAMIVKSTAAHQCHSGSTMDCLGIATNRNKDAIPHLVHLIKTRKLVLSRNGAHHKVVERKYLDSGVEILILDKEGIFLVILRHGCDIRVGYCTCTVFAFSSSVWQHNRLNFLLPAQFKLLSVPIIILWI